MHMTLRQWGNRNCPGEFITADFACWEDTSPFFPGERLYHLVITTGKDVHPFFPDKYASRSHTFFSFYGLTRYLKKSPDEIVGEVF